MSDARLIAVDELTRRVAGIFVSAKTSEENAAAVARALVQAEIDGQRGHGLTRIESYAAQSRAGKVNGFAVPSIARTKPGAMMVDVGGGFAYPAIDRMIEALPAAAREAGVVGAALHRSHHCGAMGWHVERLADLGLVALAFANAPDAMAPWGGAKRLYGTNPIAFGAPRRHAMPIVVDLALSEVARGKILAAAGRGEPIPEGWASDAEGRPTTDAKAALAGTLMPIGGAKGAALALMVEVLAVTLGGANFAFEASSFFDDSGGPPGVGQFFVGIDPAAFGGRETFLARIETIAALIEDDPGTRVPGARRADLRAAAQRDGLAVDGDVLEKIDKLGAQS